MSCTVDLEPAMSRRLAPRPLTSPAIPPVYASCVRTVRNIAIIAVLALIVDVAPAGGHEADGILALISIVFLALIGAAGYQLYRQYRFEYLGLTDRQRALCVGSLGAI